MTYIDTYCLTNKQVSRLRWTKLTLFFLIFCSIPLFSESKQIYKKIYFENLSSVGAVRTVISTRVRNHLSLSILRHFKSKYTFIDDSVVQGQLSFLKKQKNLSCENDKCYKLIEDNLSPNEKITGNLQTNGTKYILTLRLLDVTNGGGELKQKEVSFTNNQLEYFVGEITRALLDSDYTMNMEGVPLDSGQVAIDLGNIEVNEIQGVDIKTVKFKGNDFKTNEVINSLKKELVQGDTFFNKKKYESALKSYENLLKNLQSSLSQNSRDSIKKYINGIEKRIYNSKKNILIEKVKSLDEKFKSNNSINEKSLEEFYKKYEAIKSYLVSFDYQDSELSTIINDIIRRIEISILQLQEIEADDLYEKYNFTNSLESYEKILNRNKFTKRLEVQDKAIVQSKIEKKINIVKETGTSYYASQVRSYCNIAEKEYVKLNIRRKKNKNIELNKTVVIDNIKKAEIIIRSNTLIDKETIEYYNSVVLELNKNGENFGVVLTYSDIKKKDNLADDAKEEFKLSKSLLINSIYPGSLYDDYGHTKTGYFIKFGFFASLAVYGSQIAQYQSLTSAYSQKDSLLLDYFIFNNTDSTLGLLYYNSKTSELESIASQGAQTAQLGNIFLASAVSFYVFSWTPALFGSPQPSSVLYDNWNFTLTPKIIPSREGLLNRELQFGLEGRF